LTILIFAVGVDLVAHNIELIRVEGIDCFISKLIKSKHLNGLEINPNYYRDVNAPHPTAEFGINRLFFKLTIGKNICRYQIQCKALGISRF